MLIKYVVVHQREERAAQANQYMSSYFEVWGRMKGRVELCFINAGKKNLEFFKAISLRERREQKGPKTVQRTDLRSLTH